MPWQVQLIAGAGLDDAGFTDKKLMPRTMTNITKPKLILLLLIAFSSYVASLSLRGSTQDCGHSATTTLEVRIYRAQTLILRKGNVRLARKALVSRFARMINQY